MNPGLTIFLVNWSLNILQVGNQQKKGRLVKRNLQKVVGYRVYDPSKAEID